MRIYILPILMMTLPLLLAADGDCAKKPISLHPENPHYLLFRGKPTILVTSGEHYGAVLNLDFDYIPYLDELKRDGLNLTRTFSGTYREIPESFGITGNTLAPASMRYCAPWARCDTPGYPGGGNKFDLTKWDADYFKRLKDFISQAGKRGIVVELVLFCTMYDDRLWEMSPMNAKSNINGIGNIGRRDPFTLRDAKLQEVQDQFVRKVVTELKDFDNLYYEICNEPYFEGVTLQWQAHIADVIVQTEKTLSIRHLIAQNIANDYAKVDKLNPHVSIVNFHYARPEAALDNLKLNVALGNDETGFNGSEDATYRYQGWRFMLSGGAIYDNLDYSFTPDQENGSAVPKAPGGGGKALRAQLGIMKKFLTSFDFLKLRPDASVIQEGVPNGGAVHILADPGRAYAVYLKGGQQANLTLDLPKGQYRAEWINTLNGKTDKKESFTHSGGDRQFSSPDYPPGDIALRIHRIGTK
ncbi:MAG: cellulase family glycosylhydrolase [Armatimonadota bacterium]